MDVSRRFWHICLSILAAVMGYPIRLDARGLPIQRKGKGNPLLWGARVSKRVNPLKVPSPIVLSLLSPMLHLPHLLRNYSPIGTEQATQPRAMLAAVVEAIAEEDGRTRTGKQEAISGIIPITVGRHVNTKSVDSISSVSDLPTVAPIVHQLQTWECPLLQTAPILILGKRF